MIEFLTEHGIDVFAVIMIYWILISLCASVVTIADKFRAKRQGARRVPEKTLLLLSALGGSISMLLTMLLIRHKTKHIKFMLGIPLIILIQVALIVALLFLI
jgi:uncharacterized membrane protein YsdA (DUF1294 family)